MVVLREFFIEHLRATASKCKVTFKELLSVFELWKENIAFYSNYFFLWK